MQHDHVLNKLTLDHRVGGAGRGDLGPKYLHVAAFICNIKVEWGREKVCRQNICCHVFEFENLFNLI